MKYVSLNQLTDFCMSRFFTVKNNYQQGLIFCFQFPSNTQTFLWGLIFSSKNFAFDKNCQTSWIIFLDAVSTGLCNYFLLQHKFLILQLTAVN